MLARTLFDFGYSITKPKVISYYKDFCEKKFIGIESLQREQDLSLQKLISFCIDYVPYYQDLFKKLGIKKGDFKSINDLNFLPILTKKQIKEDPDRFKPHGVPVDFVYGSTGGSTGEPLKYKMSIDCYARGVALLYRGWGYAGYSLSDKVSIIAGSSLVSKEKPLKAKLYDFILNMRHYSSYGMASDDLNYYVHHLQTWRPYYLRGYASALYLLAKYIDESGSNFNHALRGIFSTSEVLTVNQRQMIEKVFKVKVFDQYGLNDGGISAFECAEHNGMHIDMERSVLEVVDDKNISNINKVGKIIATNLYNYAMPLIRYDTGDLGCVDTSPCACGNKRYLLKNVSGRITDYLKLNDKMIGSPVLTVLMGGVDVESYQIIQNRNNSILVKYVNGSIISDVDKSFIVNSLCSHVGKVFVEFQKVSAAELYTDNKFKFIINDKFR